MIKNYIIAGLLIVSVILFGIRSCEPNSSKIEQIHDTITVTKERIRVEKQEIVKWKQAKEKIHYVTKFDTLATIDTVIVELIKCDQIVKIDSIIIDKKDSTIIDQDKLLALKDQQAKEVKKSDRKGKLKAFFKGFVTGYIAGILTPL